MPTNASSPAPYAYASNRTIRIYGHAYRGHTDYRFSSWVDFARLLPFILLGYAVNRMNGPRKAVDGMSQFLTKDDSSLVLRDYIFPGRRKGSLLIVMTIFQSTLNTNRRPNADLRARCLKSFSSAPNKGRSFRPCLRGSGDAPQGPRPPLARICGPSGRFSQIWILFPFRIIDPSRRLSKSGCRRDLLPSIASVLPHFCRQMSFYWPILSNHKIQAIG